MLKRLSIYQRLGLYITTPHFSRLLRHAWGYGGHILDLNPRVPTGEVKAKGLASAPLDNSSLRVLCMDYILLI